MKGLTKILHVGPEAAKEVFGCKEAFIGFAGNTNVWSDVIQWFYDRTQKPPRCRDIEFLMVTNEKKVFTSTNLRNWVLITNGFHAIGSGGEYALGAMSAGKSPLEAVKVAGKHDIYTGMGYKEYTFI